MDRNSSNNLLETLSETITCTICFASSDDPHLCPECSKLYCLKCITEWLNQRNICPNCKKILRKTNLVKIRWLDDITKVLNESMGENGLFTEDENGEIIEDNSVNGLCTVHKKEQVMFCSSCEICTCLECCKDKHKLHSFKNIEAIYDSTMQILEAKFKIVEDRRDKIGLITEKMVDNMDEIKKAKFEKLEQLKKMYVQNMRDEQNKFSTKLKQKFKMQKSVNSKLEKMQWLYEQQVTDIEKQYVLKYEQYGVNNGKIKKLFEDYEKLLQEFNDAKMKSKAQIIHKKQDLLNKFNKKCADKIPQDNVILVSKDFIRIGEFVIKKFSSLSKFFSTYSNSVLDHDGNIWKLNTKLSLDQSDIIVHVALVHGQPIKTRKALHILNQLTGETYEYNIDVAFDKKMGWYTYKMPITLSERYINRLNDSMKFSFYIYAKS